MLRKHLLERNTRKETSAHANTKKTCYLNSCCSIQTTSKSALCQKKEYILTSVFQLELIKIHKQHLRRNTLG